MGKKKFAVAELNPEYETYIIYVGLVSFVASPSSFLLDVHPFRRLQIAKKASTKVFNEYIKFAFSPDLVSKFPEYTGINNHTIKLVNNQQLRYGPIYSLRPVNYESLY